MFGFLGNPKNPKPSVNASSGRVISVFEGSKQHLLSFGGLGCLGKHIVNQMWDPFKKSLKFDKQTKKHKKKLPMPASHKELDG